jgi:GntR family transcriptional regulator, transcriptional repressor for pyruvate dehydrogenase complex
MTSIKLNRSTLAEQVAQLLVERIETDGLKPGDPLPSIAKLAEEFSVSKPIIREALKTLEGRELIEISNGKTPIVKPISSESLRMFFERAVALEPRALIELLEIRRGLEIQSVLLAAKNRRENDVEQMRTLVRDMAVNLYQAEDYTELDLKLHLLIASASGNHLMYHLVQSIRDVLKDTIKEGLRSRFSDEQIRQVQNLHERIVDAIDTGNPAAASEAMAAHFDDAINAIYRSMVKVGGE